jgi:cold shock CspA family protein
MRYTGILRTWRDDKGFGFIAPTHGGAELFVHISEFAKNTGRPIQGESLIYELGTGKDGKPQAVRVTRKAVGTVSARNTKDAKPQPPSINLLGLIASVFIVCGIGIYGFKQYESYSHRLELANRPAEPVKAEPVLTEPTISTNHLSEYKCDGRNKCGQMTSCKEATWFINNCSGMEMDGDNDGVPCEDHHCKQSFN